MGIGRNQTPDVLAPREDRTDDRLRGIATLAPLPRARVRPGARSLLLRALVIVLICAGTALAQARPGGGGRPSGGRPSGGGGRPAASRPAPSRPAASRPAPSRPAASRPAASRPAASRPAPSRPAAARPAPSRSAASRPAPTRSASRTAPARPQGARPASAPSARPRGVTAPSATSRSTPASIGTPSTGRSAASRSQRPRSAGTLTGSRGASADRTSAIAPRSSGSGSDRRSVAGTRSSGRTASTSASTSAGRTRGDPTLRADLRQRFGLDRSGSARSSVSPRSAENSSRRIQDVRRDFQLGGRGDATRTGRADVSAARIGRAEVQASRSGGVERVPARRADTLRGGADSVSRRLAGADAEVGRRVAARDIRAAAGPGLTGSGRADRIPPTVSGSPSGGGATVIPPVSHTPGASSYYGSYHGGYSSGGHYPYYSGYAPRYHCSSSYPWFGFSIGFSFGYSWCSPWYSWSCGYGYPYYRGYPYYGYCYDSPAYWGWYGYPCYTVRYASPYYYRYRSSYYCTAPIYYYDGCYYGFTYAYGYVPYYQSSYIEYRRIVEAPEEAPDPEPRTERALSAAELRFCEGWTLLRAGDAANASQVLYTSTIELEDSPLVHWFLAVALASGDDIALAQRTLGEALRLDPDFLRHRWNPVAHLGEDGDRVLREKLAALRTDDPLAAAPLALEASLSLLADDQFRLEALRGVIAESLIVDPEAPGLAESLAEIRRRGELGEDRVVEPHRDAIADGWLASPSCESIPSLGVR